MPLIQIDLDRELFDSLGDKLSDAVHQAQLDALDIPSDDLFQVFTPHGPGELRFDPGYNGVDLQRFPTSCGLSRRRPLRTALWLD